ncbi:MAG: Mutator family transposase [Actinomycetota bacterium]|nr:Mutator family transposase [Actinomycetota bacterium]
MAGVFGDRDAVIRLVGAVPTEHHDERITGRPDVILEVLKTSRLTAVPSDLTTDTTPRDSTRIGARERSATMGRVDGFHP